MYIFVSCKFWLLNCKIRFAREKVLELFLFTPYPKESKFGLVITWHIICMHKIEFWLLNDE